MPDESAPQFKAGDIGRNHNDRGSHQDSPRWRNPLQDAQRRAKHPSSIADHEEALTYARTPNPPEDADGRCRPRIDRRRLNPIVAAAWNATD